MIFKSTIYPEQSIKQPYFVHADTDSQRLKFAQKFLVGHGQNMSLEFGQSDFWTLKLTVHSQE